MGILASPSFAGFDALLWFFVLFTAAIVVMVACIGLAIVSLVKTRPFPLYVIIGNAVFSAAATATMLWLVFAGLKRWFAIAISIGTAAFVLVMAFLTSACVLRGRSSRRTD